MPARDGAPPAGVLVLATLCAVFTAGFVVLTVMSLGMTTDPDVPRAIAWSVVGFLAFVAALFAWVTWGILRGSRRIGERLLAPDPSLSGIVTQAIIERLLRSDEARRWFDLPPRGHA